MYRMAYNFNHYYYNFFLIIIIIIIVIIIKLDPAMGWEKMYVC